MGMSSTWVQNVHIKQFIVLHFQGRDKWGENYLSSVFLSRKSFCFVCIVLLHGTFWL